jgi:hypothetical protein
MEFSSSTSGAIVAGGQLPLKTTGSLTLRVTPVDSGSVFIALVEYFEGDQLKNIISMNTPLNFFMLFRGSGDIVKPNFLDFKSTIPYIIWAELSQKLEKFTNFYIKFFIEKPTKPSYFPLVPTSSEEGLFSSPSI